MRKAKTEVGDQDDLELVQSSSQRIPKPPVFPVPKGTLQRIFGTSQVFQGVNYTRPKTTDITVPLRVREYYHQGQQRLEQEDWPGAVLYFNRALHLDPQLVEFYALRAEAFLQLCDFSSATQNLRRAYTAQPENTKYLERLTFVLHLQGQSLYEQCSFQEALNVFRQASELQPEKACFHYRRMACLLALNRHHDCLRLVNNEVRQGTANADLYILRARIYNFFRKPSLCYRDLCSALLLDSKHPQARVLLQMMVAQAQKAHQDAGVLAIQGKLQHALQCIHGAIENNPLDPNFFLFRGTMYRRLQEFDRAIDDFLKTLDMATAGQDGLVRQAQRQLLLTYNDFAVQCYKQGAYQEGVQLLNKALRDEQREKGLYLNRGDCFFQLGNLTFAEADYKQALALSPKDEGANMRMGLLQEKMGFCEQTRRQFQKAETHFSVAIAHNPQRAQYYLYRAKSRQLLQDIFGARQDIATVLLLNPKEPKLFMLMTSLFPGMSEEEVLRSQVAHLAKLQLEQMVQKGPQARGPQGIVGLPRMQDLERQKGQSLQLSWKLEGPLFAASREPEATPRGLKLTDTGAQDFRLHGDQSPWGLSLRSQRMGTWSTEPRPSSMGWVPGVSSACRPSYRDDGAKGPAAWGLADSRAELDSNPLLALVRRGRGLTLHSAGAPLAQKVPIAEGKREAQKSLEHHLSDCSPSVLPSNFPSCSHSLFRSSHNLVLQFGFAVTPQKSQDKRELSVHKMMSLSDSYPDQTSSDSIHGLRTPSTSETGTSATEQGYKDTSSTTGTLSESSLLNTQSSDSSDTRDSLSLGHGPRKTQTTQQAEGSGKTKATQPLRKRPKKTKATQGLRQRFRRAKTAHGQSLRTSKAGAPQGQGPELAQSSSNTKVSCDPSCSLKNPRVTQCQGWKPNKTEAALSPKKGTSLSSSRAAQRLSSGLSHSDPP
ncbi:tetratricopeptide repeat protein 16 [Ctenodactylus gundi]